MENRRVITEPRQINTFTFAGRALFTLKSRKTENRFTYKVKASKDKKVFFVSVKIDSSFVYLGYIKDYARTEVIWTQKSKVQNDSKEFVSFKWFLNHIGHEAIEFWHEGRCGHCSKKLTVPESIATGIGPVCLGRKVSKEDLKKVQVKQAIDSINDLIKGHVKMTDPGFKDIVRVAKNDLIESRRRAKFEK